MEQKSNSNAKQNEANDDTIITNLEKKVSLRNKMKSVALPTFTIFLTISIAIALVFIIKFTN